MTSIPSSPHRDYRLTFGMFEGCTLADVASTDRGLCYLGWILDEFDDGRIRSIVEEFVEDENLSGRIDEAECRFEAACQQHLRLREDDCLCDFDFEF